MSEEFDLSEKMKKINWELTAETHLDDGRQYGGGVWLYFHRDVKEFIRLDGEIIDDFIRGLIDEAELIARRNKLCGEKLK